MAIKTVAAIIEKQSKFLLMKRLNTHAFEGFWTLPGGKIDKGESKKEAVKREVREETNLLFKPEKFLGRYHEDFPEYGWDADSFVFTGSFSGKVKGNEESSKIDWFSKKEIYWMKLAFHHKKIIADFFSRFSK